MWTVPSPSSDARTCWPRRHLPGHNRNAAETGPQSLALAACDAYSLRTFPEGVRWPSCVRPDRNCTRPWPDAPASFVREATAPKPRLLDRVRAALRVRHYSRSTEEACVAWIRRYVLFHGKRHPAELSGPEVTRFLSALAVEGRVAASTQNQALSALLFLYREVLGVELPWLDDIVRASRPARLPVVLTRDEVSAVLQHPDHSGATGPPRRDDHADLRPCTQPRARRRPQPRRPAPQPVMLAARYFRADEIGRPRRAAYPDWDRHRTHRSKRGAEWGNGPHWPPATAREGRQRLQPPLSYTTGSAGLSTFSSTA